MSFYVRDLWYGFVFMAVLIALGYVILLSGNPHPFRPPFKPNASFHGYACYDDCQDHHLGYDWARREGVTDPAQCRHIARSFSEGCRAWVRDGARASGATPK